MSRAKSLQQGDSDIELPTVAKDEDAFTLYRLPSLIQNLNIAGCGRLCVGGFQAGIDHDGVQQQETRQSLGQEMPRQTRQRRMVGWSLTSMAAHLSNH